MNPLSIKLHKWLSRAKTLKAKKLTLSRIEFQKSVTFEAREVTESMVWVIYLATNFAEVDSPH
jgi:hypothetical protein